MLVEIFDVEHGGCALVTADSGAQMLIDGGHNSATGWRPSTALPARGVNEVELFVITNMDEDHVSDLPNLRKTVTLHSLRTNRSITPEALRSMKAEGGMGPGITSAYDMIKRYTGPGRQTDWGSMTQQVFLEQVRR